MLGSRTIHVALRCADYLTVTVLAVVLTACDRGTLNPVSDVPCLDPTAWADETRGFLVRPEFEGRNILLFTHQTTEQLIEGGHGPVYRFDLENETFELVDDAPWDQTEGGITSCGGGRGRESPFGIVGSLTPTLEFTGQDVPVEGGAAVKLIFAPAAPAVAVLSTDGSVQPPLFSSGFSFGQHYHQLFSEIDGKPIGEAVRLGVGGQVLALVRGCWIDGDKYLIYSQGQERPASGVGLLCVVRIDEELPMLEDE